jgi:lysophospholipase L1-like esterase
VAVGSALAALAVVAVAAGAPATPARERAARAAGPARWYLALGDSLARGMQPDSAGITRNTSEGYANQLYAIERTHIPGLRLVNLGCGGETTGSFLTGRGNRDALLLNCHPAGGSQMAAAVRFLRAHHRRGEVAAVTIDIGANDIDGCVSGTKVDLECVEAGIAHARRNIPVILRRLRAAAPPGTRFASMTLYDPFLAIYLLPHAQGEARDVNQYAGAINNGLEALYRAGHFLIARVAQAFHTYDLSRTTTLPNHPNPLPVAVAEVCRLTWMCAPPPVGPNIHANRSGYGVIARAFAAALGRLR